MITITKENVQKALPRMININKIGGEENAKNIQWANVTELDFLIVFYIRDEELECPHIIYKSELSEIGMTEEELYEIAKENLKKKVKLDTLPNILTGMLLLPKGCDVPEESVTNNMIVVTTQDMLYGAPVILLDEVLEDVSKRLGEDKFIVLPSSVHEVSCVPMDNVSELRNIVKDINRNVVSDSEFLSDNIYIYEGNGILNIA